VILITGPKGVGKTQLVKTLAYLYHMHFPQNRVIIFCGIKGLYQDLPYAIHVDLDEVAQEESEKFKSDFSGIPDTSEFKNSLVIFDDTERHSNPKIERMLYQLVNVLAQNGRNFNVCLLVVLHQLNKGLQSRSVKIIFYIGLNMSVYGYGNVGMGYRYPRRARKAVIADPMKWARAAIYNKGVVEENPWVQHLKKKGVYDKIRALLQEAKKDYVPKNPEKRRESLMRQMENLQDEYNVIAADYPILRQGYKYTAMPYDLARQAVLDKLDKRIKAIAKELGIGPKPGLIGPPPSTPELMSTESMTPLYLS
jgi:hypothetical protein